jgi:hypothetical protein
MFSVLLNLITQPVSSARLRHEAALLLSELFPADEDVVINLAHVSLGSADGQLVESCHEAMCRTLAHWRVTWAGRQVSALQKLGGDDALMDQLYVNIVESASPSASALLLVLTVNFPMDTKYYETTLRRCLEQLATQPASWQPVHLWFMYAVLATSPTCSKERRHGKRSVYGACGSVGDGRGIRATGVLYPRSSVALEASAACGPDRAPPTVPHAR